MATSAQRGSGTPATTGTTWATTTNAVDGAAGTNPATYTTLTSTTSGAVATIEVSGYGFSAAVPSDATLTSVTVNVRHFENNTGRFASVVFQPYDGATAIGSLFTATLATSARNDSTTFSPTLAQLRSATFKIRVTITGAASTQSRVCSIDYADVTVVYTAPVKQGSATTTWTAALSATDKRNPVGAATVGWSETASATGVAPVPVVPGVRVLETSVGRQLEDATARVLEEFVVAVPNDGTATSAWTATVTAAGRKTPNGTAATSYVETVTAAGKRTARATATTAHAWAVTATGRKAPQATATTSWLEATSASGRRIYNGPASGNHTWATAAAGVKPAVGVNDGSGTVSHLYALAAAGKRAPRGTATVAYTETPVSVGKRTPKATATTAHTWTLIAQGVKPAAGVSQGSGLGYVVWTPTASGARSSRGQATTTGLWAVSAAGTKPVVVVKQGSATVTATWTTAAAGRHPPRKGSATTQHLWNVPSAQGKRTPRSVLTVAVVHATAATGRRMSKGQGVVLYVYSPAGGGFTGSVAVTGLINGYETDRMMWGDRVVIDFLLTAPD